MTTQLETEAAAANHTSLSRSRHLLCLAAALPLVVAALHSLLYIGMYAGDAEIHLVFARNAAHGHFFEFNPGEIVAGETSPGYMVILAALFRIAGDVSVPYIAKSLGIASVLALVALTVVAAQRLNLGPWWACAAATVVGAMPGLVYNSTTGMENGLFAVVVLAFWAAAISTSWFEVGGSLSLTLELAMGALLGLGCFLRPEGIVVAVVALLCRGPRRSVVSTLACTAIAAATIAFQAFYTGRLVPGSALARIAIASQGAIALGPLMLDPSIALRLAAYLPLTLLFVLGAWRVATDRHDPSRGALRFAVVLPALFAVLFTVVLGAAHLARYTIFLVPLAAVVSVIGGRWAWVQLGARSLVVRNAAFIIAAFALVAAFAIEARLRGGLGQAQELVHASDAGRMRSAYSDMLYAQLGSPADRPIVVACQEVQVRYWLDDRFIVRSLDGRVDPLMLEYVRDGRYDHTGYLKARSVQFLLDTPNYNHEADQWSLDQLDVLRTGEATEHDGLTFTRLAEPGLFQITTNAGPVSSPRVVY